MGGAVVTLASDPTVSFFVERKDYVSRPSVEHARVHETLLVGGNPQLKEHSRVDKLSAALQAS